MDNGTEVGDVLQIEGFDIAPQFVYPVFFILLLTYLTIMVTNTGVMVLIATERSLQQPMYLLFCNLSFNDIIGNTNILPRMLSHLLSSERHIGYAECVVQAFISHVYGTAAHTVLMIMAFDRYVAICNPLRYSSIMTTGMVARLSAFAWGVAFIMVSVLLGLTVRLTRCRSVIINSYCDNASLFKLSCQDVTVNNIYGLVFTALLFGSSVGSFVVTYLRIVAVCLSRKSKELNGKALQTCASHFVLYVILLSSGFSTILSHRFQISSGFRKLTSILFHILPAYLNPVIYAAQTKELKNKINKLFRPKIVVCKRF